MIFMSAGSILLNMFGMNGLYVGVIVTLMNLHGYAKNAWTHAEICFIAYISFSTVETFNCLQYLIPAIGNINKYFEDKHDDSYRSALICHWSWLLLKASKFPDFIMCIIRDAPQLMTTESLNWSNEWQNANNKREIIHPTNLFLNGIFKCVFCFAFLRRADKAIS